MNLYVGRTVWIYIRGLVIQCKITYIDMTYRNKHKDGIIFYDVDEPIGHSINENEIFLRKKDAMRLQKEDKHISGFRKTTLGEFRESQINFIASTHKGHEAESKAYLKTLYRPKLKNIEWFD
jgi:hypothetical protein